MILSIILTGVVLVGIFILLLTVGVVSTEDFIVLSMEGMPMAGFMLHFTLPTEIILFGIDTTDFGETTTSTEDPMRKTIEESDLMLDRLG